MNTPELTLKQLQEMEAMMRASDEGSHPHWEALRDELYVNAPYLLSLARLQIESQGVTGKPEGSSSTSVACAPPAHSDVVPVSEYVDIEVVSGVEGSSLCINGKRICGPKPWGGGKVIHSWRAQVQWIREVVERKLTAPPIHTEESPSDYELLTHLESLLWKKNGNVYYSPGDSSVGVEPSYFINGEHETLARATDLRSAIKAAMEQEK